MSGYASTFPVESPVMARTGHPLSPLERLFSLFTKVGPGEGRSVVLFALNAFLLLVCYYLLKTTREVFILTEYGAEAASYAIGAQALLLLFVVPLYGVLFRATDTTALIRWITLMFVVAIGVFYVLGRAGVEIGFVYYVFVGLFGVLAIAQFWAFATDCYNVKSGQRLFPVIMIGASAGALAGAQAAKFLGWLGFATIETLWVAALTLLLTLLLGTSAFRSVPVSARPVESPESTEPLDKLEQALGGFAVVFRNRYLVMIVVLVLLLNWVNSTGEVILKDFVGRWATEQVALGLVADRSTAIAAFFGDFFFWVNLGGLVLQAFLVSRVYRWVGVSGALLILPIIAAVGYGLISFAIVLVPMFSIVKWVKVLENSVDYSVMNTTRQAIFLPLDKVEKYEGKMAIDTFFWRVGDMVQAGAFFVGLNYLGMSIVQFALVNMVLAFAWFFVAMMIGRRYRYLLANNVVNAAPELTRPIPDAVALPGADVLHKLEEDLFVDRDPGDLLSYSAQLATGGLLPSWIVFDAATLTFKGRAPEDAIGHLHIEVVATDTENLSATGTFFVFHSAER
jgi:AAA family ATP:ADP antiporter